MSQNAENNAAVPYVKPDRRSMTCSHCNRKGHDVKTCFQLHPHLKPASYKPRASGSAFAAPTATSHTNKDVWYVDTGASQHICLRRDWFSQYVDLTTSVEISLGDGRVHHAQGIGSVEVLADVAGQQIKLHFNDVLYVPSMTFNLLSTSAIDDEYSFIIKKGVISLFDTTDKLVANAPKGSSKLYELQGSTIVQSFANASIVQACVAGSQQLDLWHQRLGHLGMNNLLKLQLCIDKRVSTGCLSSGSLRLMAATFSRCSNNLGASRWGRVRSIIPFSHLAAQLSEVCTITVCLA